MVSDRHVWFPQLLEDFLFDSLILILAGTTQQQFVHVFVLHGGVCVNPQLKRFKAVWSITQPKNAPKRRILANEFDDV